ncbi:low specificity L-threonine aldolase [Rhizobium sp. L1K21]|uniref:threonine aldolase family protein n=1 Tax=Rhizobium sp. L1K21 TaxID=2954933 RepID=UPI0020931CFD|nr:low specificity L-threonine aldolase [Rhizobium sp. L1K21]MCO6185025.1 low specificity L-threonine aldolase [Rhizobium sp. L1K21]
MFFASDNWAGAHPKIASRLSTEAGGFAPAYGASPLDKKVEAKFNEIFEREVAVFFVSTGTAANSLALASVGRPGGVIFCHESAHVFMDECGAPGFFSSAARLAPVDGPDGKISPRQLERTIKSVPPEFIHAGQPMAVTITQATESGTVYSLDEISAMAAIAQKYKVPLHMDGARLTNAMQALGTTPAEMTWKRGVDILSFGATKNGCWCAEAIVFMNPDDARQLPFIRKQSAQLFSKTRFIAAQFDAYFEDGLWLEMANHANTMADMLRAGFEASNHSSLAWPTQSNEVFAIIKKAKAAELREKGAVFYDWHGVPENVYDAMEDDDVLIRLVTSFATESADVARFVDALN